MDVCCLHRLCRSELKGSSGMGKEQVYMAQVMAYQGRYQEAAKVYAKCGTF